MSSLKPPISDENCWELTKENIQPLKAGRSISNVSSSNEMSLKQQRQNFEEELRMNTGDDPLDVWYRYIKWTEQNFPAGKDNQLRSLIQKCLSVLKEQKQYANDFRWWFVWQKFALLSSNVGSLGIYEFMHSSDHCTRLASFYKQWAYELEQAEDFPKATEVYKKGILAKAQPLSDLENAFHEFEMRIGRKLLTHNEDDDVVDESTRNFLGVLKGVGKKATAPAIRQSSTQEVKITKPIEKTSTTNRGFAVFDEKQESQRSSSQNLPTAKAMHVGSVGNESTKENLRNPDVWTKQKVKIGNLPSAKDNVSEFRVFVDENLSSDDQKPKPLIAGGVLKPVAKQELVSSFFRSENVEKPKSTNKTELKEVPAYNDKLIYGGLIEMSFEEMRALNYQPKKAKPNSNLPLNCSNGVAKQCPTTIMNLPLQKTNHQLPNAPAIIANTSFTSNVYRDVMAVFSNTINLPGSCDGSNPCLDNSSSLSKIEQSFEPPPQVMKAPAPVVGFQIFDENAECENRNRSSTLPSNNENKENMHPLEIVTQRGFKRQTSGILTPALDIVSESEDKILTEEIAPTKLFSAASSSNFPAMVAQNVTVDDYDPTVAGLMKTLLAERAASTPCHTQTMLMVPSFSMTKQWQIPFDIENQASFETEDVTGRQKSSKAEEVVIKTDHYLEETEHDFLAPPACNNFVDRKLSTITETSREYRSSSCSSSSSGSSGDAFSTRRRLLCASTNSTNLQPIAEQLTFAHCTPSSQAALFGITPQDHASAIVHQPTTPYDVFQTAAHSADAKAVRRLYSDNENVDENVDRTGFGTKMSITSRINPWDPEIIAQLLMRIPKRLDMFTNFHHFSSNLPSVKVGKNVDLGGETYAVERFLGEGAFARVYKCFSEDNPGSSLVLKVQKPCCPWEFYVCEELRRRMIQQNLLSTVPRAIMRVKDAFIFADGSVLTSDYCPNSTLLDVVNKFKTSGTAMSEAFVAYLTIEMMKILETVHACGFIHADVKPDNFLFCGPEIWPNEDHKVVYEDYVQCLCLIDWGRAIDMNLMPKGTVFSGKVDTSGFQCCEMQEGKSWTFQTDFYGLLGTIHVLLFGDYMRVYKCSSTGRWKTTSTFKRKWNVDMWRKLFDALLNISDCNSLPNLSQLRVDLESFYHTKCEKDGLTLNDHLIYLKNIIKC